jgi:Protein of unknown function (DUF3185)
LHGSGHEKQKEDFSMTQAVSLAILAAGILLTIFGITAMNSASSDLSRFFTGAPTDKAMWLLIGGIVASVVGLVGLLPRSKAS